MFQVSGVTCQGSDVICHVSYITSSSQPVKAMNLKQDFHFIFRLLKLFGGVSVINETYASSFFLWNQFFNQEYDMPNPGRI